MRLYIETTNEWDAHPNITGLQLPPHDRCPGFSQQRNVPHIETFFTDPSGSIHLLLHGTLSSCHTAAHRVYFVTFGAF